MSLEKSRISSMVDTLIYTSATFSITCNWDGGSKYTFNVFDEVDKKLIDIKVVSDGLVYAEAAFEKLKTKYIFDYGNKLFANRKILK